MNSADREKIQLKRKKGGEYGNGREKVGGASAPSKKTRKKSSASPSEKSSRKGGMTALQTRHS